MMSEEWKDGKGKRVGTEFKEEGRKGGLENGKGKGGILFPVLTTCCQVF
jgi:hypothetical protein